MLCAKFHAKRSRIHELVACFRPIRRTVACSTPYLTRYGERRAATLHRAWHDCQTARCVVEVTTRARGRRTAHVPPRRSDLAKFPDLPQLSSFEELHEASLLGNRLISHELQRYDRDELQRIVGGVDSLNIDQQTIYDEITAGVEGTRPGQKLLFVDGPGGTGKSTLLNHMLAQVRVRGDIAIAVASSGIASLLLPGGRTAHSTFKIPIKLTQTSSCFIQKQTHLHAFIERAKLIVWDEAPMTHRHAFEAVDCTLRDILENRCDSFGEKLVVLSGDIQQILPVMKNGTVLDTVEASLRYAFLWPKFKQVHLTENMRVLRAANAQTEMELREFAELLLEVGESRHEVDEEFGQDFMKVPRDLLIPNPRLDRYEDVDGVPVSLGLQRVADAMYNQTDLNNSMVANDEYFASRMILTPTNVAVHEVNEAVATRVHGESRVYLPSDSIDDEGDGSALFEVGVLNSLNLNGIPPHKLALKKGMPVMMIRNLNPNAGLCNGTRLRIVKLKPRVIHATIMTGVYNGVRY